MIFQITDIPRIMPEILLIMLAIFVLSSDILERWGSSPKALLERSQEAARLAVVGLGLVFVVVLIQSRFLFTISEPVPANDLIGRLTGIFLNLGRNLQSGGPGGVPLIGAFSTDQLTMVARLTFVGTALLTTLLTFDYRPARNPGEFYALIIFATAGMNLMAGASELITAYLAIELSSIALYVLAGYFQDDQRSTEAGMKYFLFGVISSAILLYGMSLMYGFAIGGGRPVQGTLFSEIAQAAAGARTGSSLLTLALIFVIAGFGYKIAVVPFHSWSPDVYQGAPTPITAFISTASKAAGFMLLYRLLVSAFPSLAGTLGLNSGWASLLTFIALLTITFGNLAALPQTNAKRLLAYSSIGHAGFLLLAIILWGPDSVSGSTFGSSALLYYLITYALTNLGAFGVLAVIAAQTGSDELADLDGLWRRSPSLTLLMTLLVLSLAGVPPLAGFWAKFFVFMSGYKAGAIWLVVVAVAMTIVSLYYYLRFLKAMWINAPRAEQPIVVPPTMRTALIVATALVLLLGLFPSPIWSVLNQVTLVAGR